MGHFQAEEAQRAEEAEAESTSAGASEEWMQMTDVICFLSYYFFQKHMISSYHRLQLSNIHQHIYIHTGFYMFLQSIDSVEQLELDMSRRMSVLAMRGQRAFYSFLPSVVVEDLEAMI